MMQGLMVLIRAPRLPQRTASAMTRSELPVHGFHSTGGLVSLGGPVGTWDMRTSPEATVGVEWVREAVALGIPARPPQRNHSMPAWTADELNKVGTAEGLEVASMRPDGTLSSARTIWVVPLGEDLSVRSVNGPDSDWYRGARQRHEGHICAGGVDQDVTLLEVHDKDDAIDVAYRTKYRRYAENTLDRITSPEARSTPLRLAVRTHEQFGSITERRARPSHALDLTWDH